MKTRGTQKHVLLTGATGVIGRAIARQLAQDGYALHLTARTASKLKSLQNELKAAGVPVFIYTLNLSNIAGCRKTVQDFFQKAKLPYAMICNAGNMGALGPFVETDFKAWSRGLMENFFAHAAMIHTFAERFHKKRLSEGAVVVMSGAGVGGNSSFERMTSYSTSKAALVHLVEALASEFKTLGLTLNAIAPGAVLSGMTRQALAAGKRAGIQADRARECQTIGGVPPERAAQLASFLLGSDARSITGRMLSARFDLDAVRADPNRLERDPNLYRLRRIDEALFGVKPR
jgi:NAD(P)-dependent dehydrogenase (short-subunit alcohol dehydrogenase family)